jgi:DNA-binding GntR family transcriptional regulator
MRNLNLSANIYQTIKERIISLEFLPGERLQERALAESLYVSRTPVREALHRLSAEGWVDISSRKYIQVRAISQKDVMDIFEIRRLIEAQVIEMLCEDFLTREIIQKLILISKEMEDAKDKHKLFINLDQNFHALIINSLGNNKLTKIWQNMAEEIIWLGMIAIQRGQRFEEVLFEHNQILEALKRRKKKLAREMLLKHLDKTEEVVLEKFSLRLEELKTR